MERLIFHRPPNRTLYLFFRILRLLRTFLTLAQKRGRGF
jgi:hypothetical protein